MHFFIPFEYALFNTYLILTKQLVLHFDFYIKKIKKYAVDGFPLHINEYKLKLILIFLIDCLINIVALIIDLFKKC